MLKNFASLRHRNFCLIDKKFRLENVHGVWHSFKQFFLLFAARKIIHKHHLSTRPHNKTNKTKSCPTNTRAFLYKRNFCLFDIVFSSYFLLKLRNKKFCFPTLIRHMPICFVEFLKSWGWTKINLKSHFIPQSSAIIQTNSALLRFNDFVFWLFCYLI